MMHMFTLVLGASGATGKLLVRDLLGRGRSVKAIVRSAKKLPDDLREHPSLTVIEANVLDIAEQEFLHHVKGCDSIVSCLGHNLSLKGVFCRPHMLVRDSVRRACDAIVSPDTQGQMTKVVLMNSTGVRNPDAHEVISFGQKIVIGLLRVLLPPHLDNERAAAYLRNKLGANHPVIEWVAVRPDGLIDQDEVSPYKIFDSPTRSAIFNPGKVSRINVAHFMADLICNDPLWNEWKGKMPVIYSD